MRLPTYRLRRLVAQVCLRPFIPRLRKLLPSQVGVGTPLGCEAAVHATCYFMDQPHNDKVLLKRDVKNAFNSIRRDTVLQEAQKHLPEIYPFIWDCYSSKSSSAKFLTCNCLSVILLLRIKKLSLAISFLMCVV